MIKHIYENDPITAKWANELGTIARMVQTATSGGGVTLRRDAAGLSISFANALNMPVYGLSFPAVNVGTTGLFTGQLCVVRETVVKDSSKKVGLQSDNFGLQVAKYDLDDDRSTTFAIVNEKMSAGAEGSIYLSGLLWAQVKRTSDDASSTDVFKACSPVEGESYMLLHKEAGFCRVLSEEDALSKSDEHWALVRFDNGAPIPFLFKATSDPDSDDIIKVKRVDSNGDVVGDELEFLTIA